MIKGHPYLNIYYRYLLHSTRRSVHGRQSLANNPWFISLFVSITTLNTLGFIPKAHSSFTPWVCWFYRVLIRWYLILRINVNNTQDWLNKEYSYFFYMPTRKFSKAFHGYLLWSFFTRSAFVFFWAASCLIDTLIRNSVIVGVPEIREDTFLLITSFGEIEFLLIKLFLYMYKKYE